jgi:3-phenylpropionate/trans-cinnamate dioxygenase ferredoxin subunit
MKFKYRAVTDLGSIPVGVCRSFEMRDIRIVLAHLADGYYAIEDRCSHAESQLGVTRVYHGRQIACPMHGARFDLKTGAAKSPPAFRAIATFATRIADGKIEVALPDTGQPD